MTADHRGQDYRMRPRQIPALIVRAMLHYPTYMRARPGDRTWMTPALIALYPLLAPIVLALLIAKYAYCHLVPWRTVWTIDARSAVIAKRLRRAGRDLPTWYAYDFWAYPMGHGRGRRLMRAAVDAADQSGAVLTLKAANREIAEKIYRPYGFDYERGQHVARRPRMLRLPASPAS
jgi:GNAT superfamily N-acetyltransferase